MRNVKREREGGCERKREQDRVCCLERGRRIKRKRERKRCICIGNQFKEKDE